MVVTGCADEDLGAPTDDHTRPGRAAAPTKEWDHLAAPALGADDVSYWDGSAAEGPDGRYHLFALHE
ncbi:MAG: hypothetical protein R2705_22650 [Ilumatobacteraceae bacterium]